MTEDHLSSVGTTEYFCLRIKPLKMYEKLLKMNFLASTNILLFFGWNELSGFCTCLGKCVLNVDLLCFKLNKTSKHMLLLPLLTNSKTWIV